MDRATEMMQILENDYKNLQQLSIKATHGNITIMSIVLNDIKSVYNTLQAIKEEHENGGTE